MNINSNSNNKKGFFKKLGSAIAGRKARYFYIIVVGIGGGATFGALVDADMWIRGVLGLLTSLIFLELQQVYYLGNQIADMHPKSSVTRAVIDAQSNEYKKFTQNALEKVEKNLLEVIKTLPGLITLVTDPKLRDYLIRIGETVSKTPKQAINIINRIVTVSLEQTATGVEDVAESKLIIRNEPEIADPRWKAVFEPSDTGQCTVATSWVLPEWWDLNKVWRDENEAAIGKGLRLVRIFIVEDDEEMESNKQVMREQSQQGVQVNWIYARELREKGIEPRDFLVSNCNIVDIDNPDNTQKRLTSGSIFGEQILETRQEGGNKNPGYRLLSRSVELSAYPPEVNNARNAIEQIYKLSKRFDDSEWWSYFFDDDYVPITKYKESTTEKEIDILIKKAHLKKGMRVLDLGCAYGRIERILENILGKIEIVPVECNQKLLDQAMSNAIYVLPRRGVVTLDMRDIDTHYKEEYDLVMSMFTSWGYFREDDNHRMFGKVFSVLKNGGIFYLDIDNPSFIRTNNRLMEYKANGYNIHRWDEVRNCEELDVDGQNVNVIRRLSQFSVIYPDGKFRSKPLVSLRIYELNELRKIASEVGFEFLEAVDENGREWRSTKATHPERIIVILKKPSH
ncbi:MAG: SAM-dependent methyltransferase [Promethearchaeota archaeon]